MRDHPTRQLRDFSEGNLMFNGRTGAQSVACECKVCTFVFTAEPPKKKKRVEPPKKGVVTTETDGEPRCQVKASESSKALEKEKCNPKHLVSSYCSLTTQSLVSEF